MISVSEGDHNQCRGGGCALPRPAELCELGATPKLCRLSVDPDTVDRYQVPPIFLIRAPHGYFQQTYLLKGRLDDLIQVIVRNVRKQVPDCISRLGIDCDLVNVSVCLRILLVGTK